MVVLDRRLSDTTMAASWDACPIVNWLAACWSAPGRSLPIDPNDYVQFDQLRTWAKLRIRGEGPSPDQVLATR
jgi:hypothetical protein